MRELGRAVPAALVTGVMLTPILWMIGMSMKPPIEVITPSLNLMPRAPTTSHYATLLEAGILEKILNSVIVTAGATTLSLALAVPAAYALARMRMPAALDSVFLIFVLLVKLAPPLVLAIPLYQVLSSLGLLDTLAGLILTYQIYALPFAIWMLLGFIRDVPLAYEEAAMLDGAGIRQRITTIVLPLIAPGITATAIFVAILCWNEFAYALLFIQSPSNFTLPTFIATLITEDETLWGQLTSIGVIASLPILAVLAAFHGLLIRGFSGGLK